MRVIGYIVKIAILLVAFLLVLLFSMAAYWYLRPNEARVDPALGAEVWPAVQDGMHNSNTDLIYWDNQFFLVHARSRYHMGNTASQLVVLRSLDAENWEEVAQLSVEGEDIRDPKFAVINDRLTLYGLKNISFEPEPYGTVVSTSQDGVLWSQFEEVDPQGWLLWRPKTLDGELWYAPAYWHEHGKSVLLASTDGRRWTIVSTIHEGDRNDETAAEFLPDGRLLVTARLEGERAWHQGSPDAATLLAVARPPYSKWTKTTSTVTRLDGPALFRYNGQVYAVGRYDPEGRDQWFGMSSLLGRKRTALYLVREDELVYLSDLPSEGDTSYPGVVLLDDQLYISYYTNDVRQDVPWLLGLILPSDIMMARIELDN
ncbi:MAG: sialidase family protein, partial [Anaerolineae bacterium]